MAIFLYHTLQILIVVVGLTLYNTVKERNKVGD